MTATPSSVSRALTSGGLTKSKSQPSRIRGFREHTTGFAVIATQGADSVTVYWKEASINRGRDTSFPNMVRAAGILRRRGYVVVPSSHGPAKRSILLVTRPAEPSEGESK